jgi:hypothetical protein
MGSTDRSSSRIELVPDRHELLGFDVGIGAKREHERFVGREVFDKAASQLLGVECIAQALWCITRKVKEPRQFLWGFGKMTKA